MADGWLVIVPMVALAACTGGGNGFDNVASIDARLAGAPSDARLADAPIDAGLPDALPWCSKPPVFVNPLGGMFRKGQENSVTNTSSSVSETIWMAGPGNTRGAAIAELVYDVLGPLSVRVTATDPGAIAHVEVVLVTSTWPFAAPIVAAPFNCMVVPSPIAFVNLSDTTITDAQAAARVIFAVGTVVGLEPSSTAGNCMGSSTTPCTFSTAAVVSGACGGQTQEQFAAITAPLACF